jgi:hypothetical protein
MPKKPPTPEAGNAPEGYLAPPEPVVVDPTPTPETPVTP